MTITITGSTLTAPVRGVKAALAAQPVRVDPRAVAYVGIGAGLAALFAASAPAACVGCAAASGAIVGTTCYGAVRAVSWREAA